MRIALRILASNVQLANGLILAQGNAFALQKALSPQISRTATNLARLASMHKQSAQTCACVLRVGTLRAATDREQ